MGKTIDLLKRDVVSILIEIKQKQVILQLDNGKGYAYIYINLTAEFPKIKYSELSFSNFDLRDQFVSARMFKKEQAIEFLENESKENALNLVCIEKTIGLIKFLKDGI